MSRLGIFVLWSLLLSLPGQTLAEPRQHPVLVGGQSLEIGFPEGFVEACSRSDDARELFESSTPATSQLLACFLTESDWAQFPDLSSNDPYLGVNAFTALTHRSVTTQQFALLRKSIVTEHEKIFADAQRQIQESMERASAGASNFLEQAVEFDDLQVVPLGVFADTERSVAFAIIRKVRIATAQGVVDYSEVVASNVVLVDGKVIALNVAKAFSGDVDVAEVKRIALAWGGMHAH